MTEDCVSSIELAVSEACTNVLNHVVGTPEEYEVNVSVDEETCSISVVDTGTGFDHSTYDIEGNGDSLSVTSEGGRGIFLMRAMVDLLEFTSEPAKGTIVHIVKKLEFQPHSALRQLSVGVS